MIFILEKDMERLTSFSWCIYFEEISFKEFTVQNFLPALKHRRVILRDISDIEIGRFLMMLRVFIPHINHILYSFSSHRNYGQCRMLCLFFPTTLTHNFVCMDDI